MIPKNNTYEVFEQFAKMMTKKTSEQSDWWKQTESNLQSTRQYQEFVKESQMRLQEFTDGLKLYQSLDFKRNVQLPPVIWAMGGAKLLDYSQTTAPKAPVLLVIPSLINRSYVLDLTEKNSFLRKIAQAGIRPFLLDWGDLTPMERNFSVEDYINKYALAAFDHISLFTGSNPSVLGYCMGGMLAMGMCAERPQANKLILLASPWDFHEGKEWLIPWLYASSSSLNTMIDQSAELPAEIIQYMFTFLNPLGIIHKFRQLPQFSDNLEKMQDFAGVEDWLNDSIPLAPSVAKELLFDWYRDNKPKQGLWIINEKPIDPKDIRQPTLIIAPENDKIVSPNSPLSLTKSLPDSHMIRPDTGHIGAIIGTKSDAQVLGPIIDFIKEKKKE